jgi:hypothetical protein
MNHHRRGGIRTLPFILGKLSHITLFFWAFFIFILGKLNISEVLTCMDNKVIHDLTK